MYQALYRKYRPRTFSEVAGQEHITGTLKNQVASGRLSHAYLFIGTRGTGKTTCAKILAKAVNCEHPHDGDPCGECAACRGIDDGSVMDVVEIDAASNNSVDSVRQLREEALFSPAMVRKRVYIIDEAHMLTTQAWNALLKIIEEPPEHLMFIFATTELRKVPATILSRCQRYSFRRIAPSVLAERLNYIADREGLKLAPDAAELLARLGDGSFRDGISLLDQCSGAKLIDTEAVLSSLGLAGNLRVAELLKAVAAPDTARALAIFDELWNDGKDPAGLLSDLCALMRDLLLMSVAPQGGAELLSGGYDAQTLKALKGAFTSAELIRSMERIQETVTSIRDNPSPKTAAELCLVTLCEPKLTDGLPELRARVSRLEECGVAVPVIPHEPVPAPAPAPIPEPAPAPIPEPKPAPAPIPEPAPEPIPEPVEIPDAPDNVPAPVKAPEPASGGEDWESLAAAVKSGLPLGLRSMLNDSLQITGEFLPDELHLSVCSGFAASMFNKPDIIALFRAKASELAGRELTVRVDEMDSAGSIERRSIEELARFNGVTITE